MNFHAFTALPLRTRILVVLGAFVGGGLLLGMTIILLSEALNP